MEPRNIIVIGASAGGFDAIKKLVADLPPTLNAAIFIVWHMPPDIRGVLPRVINDMKTIHAENALDDEPITFNRIYIAPPDRHLIIQKDKVRITRGPKENRFRPAVDPLFRSAAYAYGPRVIGVILSGALDDGTAGLWVIKKYGGITVVQDPADAEVPSMPANALREVEIDYCLPVAEIGGLLVQLSMQQIAENNEANVNENENERTKVEIDIAILDKDMEPAILKYGELTPYACPECHGVLSAIKEGKRVRYRCHTGHAYSEDSLLSCITENIEENLWNAIRSTEESIFLLNHIGDHFAEANQPKLAAMYFIKAKDAEKRMQFVRKAISDNERLSIDNINEVNQLNK